MPRTANSSSRLAVRGAAGFLADLALAKITQDGLKSLRRDVFARLLDARLSLFREQNATALSNTVVFEVQNRATLLVDAIACSRTAFRSLPFWPICFLNWQLTLIVFLIVPGVGLLIRTVSRRLSHRQEPRRRPTIVRGRGKRTGGPCGPPAWRAAAAGRPLQRVEQLAAPAGHENGRDRHQRRLPR